MMFVCFCLSCKPHGSDFANSTRYNIYFALKFHYGVSGIPRITKRGRQKMNLLIVGALPVLEQKAKKRMKILK